MRLRLTLTAIVCACARGLWVYGVHNLYIHIRRRQQQQLSICIDAIAPPPPRSMFNKYSTIEARARSIYRVHTPRELFSNQQWLTQCDFWKSHLPEYDFDAPAAAPLRLFIIINLIKDQVKQMCDGGGGDVYREIWFKKFIIQNIIN